MSSGKALIGTALEIFSFSILWIFYQPSRHVYGRISWICTLWKFSWGMWGFFIILLFHNFTFSLIAADIAIWHHRDETRNAKSMCDNLAESSLGGSKVCRREAGINSKLCSQTCKLFSFLFFCLILCTAPFYLLIGVGSETCSALHHTRSPSTYPLTLFAPALAKNWKTIKKRTRSVRPAEE